MNLSLQKKLLFSFFAAAFILVLTVSGVMHYFLRDGFDSYRMQVRLQRLSTLERELIFYSSSGKNLKDLSLDDEWVSSLAELNASQYESKLGARNYNTSAASVGKRKLQLPIDLQGVTLLDSAGQYIAGERVSDGLRYEIKNNSREIIAYWLLRKRPIDHDSLGKIFITQQLEFLFILILIAVVLSIILAALLSEHFKKPILRLQNAFQKVALGQLDVRLDASRSDEVGEIAKTFNAMTAQLQNQEQIRKQWISNTSHELRAPLTVLRMSNEAMRDGLILENSGEWQKNNLKTIANLTSLVDDLQVISSYDEGSLVLKKERINLIDWLKILIQDHQTSFSAQGLNLVLQDCSLSILLMLDEQRMTQVLRNILMNSLRYTDSPGNVVVSVKVNKMMVRIIVSDSAPGVSDAALSHLFERFYRCELSRNRSTGGSGLGLAICDGIVKAHNGKIFAAHSDLGGVSVFIELPLA